MLKKVMQNGAKSTKNYARMDPQIIQNRSKIYAKINWKIDAKFVVQKSIENRALERQRVAKVISALERREVSGLEGSPDQLKVGPFDRNTLGEDPDTPMGRRPGEL